MGKKSTGKKFTGSMRYPRRSQEVFFLIPAVLLTVMVFFAAAYASGGTGLFGAGSALAAENGAAITAAAEAQAGEDLSADTTEAAATEAAEATVAADSSDKSGSDGENGETGDDSDSGGFFFSKTHIIISCLVAFAIAVVIAVVQANKKFK